MQGIRFKQDLITDIANVGNEMSTHIEVRKHKTYSGFSEQHCEAVAAYSLKEAKRCENGDFELDLVC